MPISLETPVLQVDTNVIHKVDTTNPENLYSMWTVFARCRDSVVQGRRLENLSWRLWNRETFCCETAEPPITLSATTPAKDIQRPAHATSTDDVPQLSGSVDSIVDDEALDFTSVSAPVDILRPRIRRQDSCASSRSRGKERHITSDDLEKMVVSIIEAKEPLTAPLPNIATSFSSLEPAKPSTPPDLERSGSTTTESPCKTSETPSMESLRPASSPELDVQPSRTTVIRGFSPSQVSISRPNPPHNVLSPSAIPEPTEAPAPKIVPPKKQAMFALGGSGSSGDDSFSDRGRSLETRKQAIHPPAQPKKKMFQVGSSSGEDGSANSALHAQAAMALAGQKKTASFSDKLVTQQTCTRSEPGTGSGSGSGSDNDQSETDYVDESAIDDEDDASEWEDSIEESGRSSGDEKILFERVDSKANLTSRRSLITLMLAQNERSQKLGNNASQSTPALPRTRATLHGPSLVASPNDSDEAPLMMKRTQRAPLLRPINENPRSVAQPIMTAATGMHHQAALSPRTTRRNMLATELTESLRRHLLWERSQKSSVANAVLKRRHTSQDVANLKQYPEKPFMKKDNDVNSSSWNDYFNKDSFTGYHAQGW